MLSHVGVIPPYSNSAMSSHRPPLAHPRAPQSGLLALSASPQHCPINPRSFSPTCISHRLRVALWRNRIHAPCLPHHSASPTPCCASPQRCARPTEYYSHSHLNRPSAPSVAPHCAALIPPTTILQHATPHPGLIRRSPSTISLSFLYLLPFSFIPHAAPPRAGGERRSADGLSVAARAARPACCCAPWPALSCWPRG